MNYYGTKLSDNITETPEGFLICHDVIIARTGTQDYAPFEVPVKAKTNMVTIHREKDEVLRPETISSFEGKPVTANHPDSFVTPDNWNDLAMGFVKNVRPHEEGDDGYIMADLVVTNAKAIQAVKDGLREVSCGYEADYTDLENGEGKQTNIVGNHVALVPKGRCGEKCSIKDSQSKDKGELMTFKEKLLGILSGVLGDANVDKEKAKIALDSAKAILDADEESMALSKKIDELLSKIDELLNMEKLEADAKAKADEEAKIAEDALEAAKKAKENEVTPDADTIARAEIIAPGIAKDGDVKAKAMDAFSATVEGQEIIGSLHGVTGDALFIAVSELLKVKRNATMMRPTGDSLLTPSKVTAEDLNKKFADHWANKK